MYLRSGFRSGGTSTKTTLFRGNPKGGLAKKGLARKVPTAQKRDLSGQLPPPIGSKKAPIDPEKAQICSERADFPVISVSKLWSESGKGGGKLKRGLDPPTYDTFFPPFICSRPVIFLRHRPDRPHCLRFQNWFWRARSKVRFNFRGAASGYSFRTLFGLFRGSGPEGPGDLVWGRADRNPKLHCNYA